MNWILLLLLAVAWADDDFPEKERIDCYPRPLSTEAKCKQYGCSWVPSKDSSDGTVPWCFWPRGVGGYDVSGTGKVLTLKKRSDGPTNQYGTDTSPIYFSTAYIGATFNVKIGPTGRYEIPIRLPKEKTKSTETLSYTYNTDGPFSFSVIRNSTGTKIWDTSIGGFVYSDKFIQIATYLPSDKIYGWGENVHTTLKHDFSKFSHWAMWARDEPPSYGSTKNLYGVHPFYLGLEKDGKAHGVLIWNSNAQDVTFGEAPHIVYHTIGGTLDIYFFPGPTPEEVIQQYTAHVGRPFLPAYFALGYQLSRYGYKDLDDMKSAVKRTQDAGVPLDIPYADIDYMVRYKDFTTGQKWSDFPNYAKQLHDAGLHLFLIFDPAIQVDYDSYKRGVEGSASFIEWERLDEVQNSNNDLYELTKGKKVMLSVVWPDKHVAFPDFLDPQNNTYDWWSKEFQLYHSQVPFDGIWIDMNEPAAFGTNEDNPWYYGDGDHPKTPPLKCILSGADAVWDIPPYETEAVFQMGGSLSTKTLCMLAVTARGKHRFYNTKNLYGLSEAMATQRALYESTGKRGAIISRSTFPSSGHYAGHWLGDNSASWSDLQTSVIGVQEFNMFGIPYAGSDICGFQGSAQEEMCLRWHQMGAFHPFCRNHNTHQTPYQDPGMWPSVAAAAKQALLFRYKYLPYLYSLHFDVAINGGTVIRPLFFEFPMDEKTHDLGHQFLWGSGMMIIPVLESGKSSVSGYLPQASWYSLRDTEYGKQYTAGSTAEFSAKTTELIPVLARGGVIIPRQEPATTTVAARKNPFSLLITMEYSSSTPQISFGKFYWDDGESIAYDFNTYNYYCWEMTFSVSSSQATLSINRIKAANGITMPALTEIDVLGYKYTMSGSWITVNGASVSVTANYDSGTHALKLSNSNGIFNYVDADSFTITWSHS